MTPPSVTTDFALASVSVEASSFLARARFAFDSVPSVGLNTSPWRCHSRHASRNGFLPGQSALTGFFVCGGPRSHAPYPNSPFRSSQRSRGWEHGATSSKQARTCTSLPLEKLVFDLIDEVWVGNNKKRCCVCMTQLEHLTIGQIPV